MAICPRDKLLCIWSDQFHIEKHNNIHLAKYANTAKEAQKENHVSHTYHKGWQIVVEGLCSEGSSLESLCCKTHVMQKGKLMEYTEANRRNARKVYLGRYPKHLGMLPVKKLNEKSATFSWDARHKPVRFLFEAYLKKKRIIGMKF